MDAAAVDPYLVKAQKTLNDKVALEMGRLRIRIMELETALESMAAAAQASEAAGGYGDSPR